MLSLPSLMRADRPFLLADFLSRCRLLLFLLERSKASHLRPVLTALSFSVLLLPKLLFLSRSLLRIGLPLSFSVSIYSILGKEKINFSWLFSLRICLICGRISAWCASMSDSLSFFLSGAKRPSTLGFPSSYRPREQD